MEEKSLAKATVRVMRFNPDDRKWHYIDSGESFVHFFHNPTPHTYRIVGWDKSNREVIVNCAIMCGMKYNRPHPKFHQWRDARQHVYGLNFSSENEADMFANVIEPVLAKLAESQPPAPPQQQQSARMNSTVQRADIVATPANYQLSSAAHMVSGEYAMPRAASVASTRSDQADFDRPLQTNSKVTQNGTAYEHSDARFQSSSDDSVKGHFRSSGTPPSGPRQVQSSVISRSSPDQSIPPAPKSIPPPPSSIPPPPPVSVPPFPNSGQNRLSRSNQRTSDVSIVSNGVQSDEEGDTAQADGFAAQLRAARKLHRARASSTAGAGGEHQRASVGASGGGNDMMSDLQRVLAARRRAQESGGDKLTDQPPVPDDAASRSKSSVASQDQSAPPASYAATLPGYASLRKNSQPSVNASSVNKQTNGTTFNSDSISRDDLERFKHDLLAEFRREVQQLKNEVIEALRASSNRT